MELSLDPRLGPDSDSVSVPRRNLRSFSAGPSTFPLQVSTRVTKSDVSAYRRADRGAAVLCDFAMGIGQSKHPNLSESTHERHINWAGQEEGGRP